MAVRKPELAIVLMSFVILAEASHHQRGQVSSGLKAESIIPYVNSCPKINYLFPEYDLGNSAYLLLALSLLNTAATAYRAKVLLSKVKNKQVSYLYFVTVLYWETAIASLLVIILRSAPSLLYTAGVLNFLFTLLISLRAFDSLDRSEITMLEALASRIFQAFVIFSIVEHVYLPYRIIVLTFTLSPFIQHHYFETHKSAIKWQKISQYHSSNLLNFSLLSIFFQIMTTDPYCLVYYTILIFVGPIINIVLSSPLMVKSMLAVLRGKLRCSLTRWLHKLRGSLATSTQICAICLCELDAYAVVEEGPSFQHIYAAAESSLVKTSCNHLFHSGCLLRWTYSSKRVCPLDFTKIPLSLSA